MTPNIPEVVEEVRQKFERYEAALITKDVEVLDDTFWNSPHTLRLAIHGARSLDAVQRLTEQTREEEPVIDRALRLAV